MTSLVEPMLVPVNTWPSSNIRNAFIQSPFLINLFYWMVTNWCNPKSSRLYHSKMLFSTKYEQKKILLCWKKLHNRKKLLDPSLNKRDILCLTANLIRNSGIRNKRKKIMQEMGLEPTRSCDHRHLKPARLPIPPLLRTNDILSNVVGNVNYFFSVVCVKCSLALFLFSVIP